jgi:O-antigen/teichoic acid export membrane protein
MVMLTFLFTYFWAKEWLQSIIFFWRTSSLTYILASKIPLWLSSFKNNVTFVEDNDQKAFDMALYGI